MASLIRATLDDFGLIEIDFGPIDEETWLYVPQVRTRASVESSHDLKLSALSQTTSRTTIEQQYVDNYAIESGESPGRKVIDTRTFTRPRKNRSTDANSTVCNEQAILQAAEINCNDAYAPAADHSPDTQEPLQSALNQTFDRVPQSDISGILNGTYGVGTSPLDDDVIANNNNVDLNSTFTVNGLPAQSKAQDLNATFNVEQHIESSPETETKTPDEFRFKKPLLTQNRKIALTRTSTVKEDELPNHMSPLRPLHNGSLSSTPMAKNRTTAIEIHRVDGVMVSPISGVSQNQRYYSNESLPDEHAGPAESEVGAANLPPVPNFPGKSPTDDVPCPTESITNSACSSMGSRYSSQSLESDSASVPCREEVVHRSMPDLKSSPRATNLPNPALDGRSLNRLHGSETGLRLPSGRGLQGAKPRTQLRPPQTRAAELVAPVPAAEAPRAAARSIPAPVTQTVAAPAPSGLRMPGIRMPIFSATSSNILNSTVTGKTSPAQQPAVDVPGIPRPRMSKIPGPRTIPAPTVSAAKPRFIRPPGTSK